MKAKSNKNFADYWLNTITQAINKEVAFSNEEEYDVDKVSNK